MGIEAYCKYDMLGNVSSRLPGNHSLCSQFMTSIPHFDAPMQANPLNVLPEWIDYNGHMNVASYVLAFDTALDLPLTALGLGQDEVTKSGSSCFTLESHVRYLRELREGAPLKITFQLLDADSKRLHYLQRMFHAEEGYLAATTEEVGIHIDMKQRRAVPFPPGIAAKAEAMRLAHAMLPRPVNMCAGIGLHKRRS